MRPLVPQKRERIWELDFVRGVAVLLMIFDHVMLQLYYTKNTFSNFYEVQLGFFQHAQQVADFYVHWDIRRFVRIVVVSFFLISVGVNCKFSRSNGMRALEVGLMAGIITGASGGLGPIIGFGTIVFGMLHLVCFSILLYMVIKNVWDNKYVMLFTGGLIVLLGIIADWTRVGSAPPAAENVAAIILGLKRSGPDHFGILPGAGMVLIGAYIGEVFYSERTTRLPSLAGEWNRKICYVGRNAFWFYVIHPVAIIILIVAIGLVTGYTL